MIAIAKYSEAHRLLAEGTLSRRKIAALVGISRSTVSAIASGSYAERIARKQAPIDRSIVPRGPLARCRQCGGMVYMPCWACHVRELKEKEQEMQRAARRRARKERQQSCCGPSVVPNGSATRSVPRKNRISRDKSNDAEPRTCAVAKKPLGEYGHGPPERGRSG